MLEDVQERLVYRTHIYIRTEILHYQPAQGDLAYPEKLHMMEVSVFLLIQKHFLQKLENCTICIVMYLQCSNPISLVYVR